MIHGWAKPPKKMPPARTLLFRYALMAIGFWILTYVVYGPLAYSTGGLYGFGFVLILWIIGFGIWYFDPITRRRRAAIRKFERHHSLSAWLK